VNKTNYGVEAFTATEFNKLFSGRHPRQYVKCSPWRWGRSYSPKRRKTFTSWGGCLPEKSLIENDLKLDSVTFLNFIFSLETK